MYQNKANKGSVIRSAMPPLKRGCIWYTAFRILNFKQLSSFYMLSSSSQNGLPGTRKSWYRKKGDLIVLKNEVSTNTIMANWKGNRFVRVLAIDRMCKYVLNCPSEKMR